ncbi:unnamed protein product [Urochloa humidicola]
MQFVRRLLGSHGNDAVDTENDHKMKKLDEMQKMEHHSFRYRDLATATDNFSERRLLGRGAFGRVYHGSLKDGREVAVKRVDSGADDSADWQFQNEARFLSMLRHRNVVSLLGYCTSKRILVYEFATKGSLDKLLFAGASTQLSWPRRLQVAQDVARGLLYLHEDAPIPILHRDIKPENVLLDHRWVAKIADFGIARLSPESDGGGSSVVTTLVGTRGYWAPEYFCKRSLSAKADVHSFGVLLLEIVSGKRSPAYEPPPNYQHVGSLAEHAWMLFKSGRSLELLDPAVRLTAVPDEVTMCLQLGLLCVQADKKKRPKMRHVLDILLSNKRSPLQEPTTPWYPGWPHSQPSNIVSPKGSYAGTPHHPPVAPSTTITTVFDSSSLMVSPWETYDDGLPWGPITLPSFIERLTNK